jgi:hypothetical protein
MKKRLYQALFLTVIFVSTLHAHHYKGLPHYGYFDNYPQVPMDEFLARSGKYEFSLVVYDFQGMTKQNVEQPDDVRLFLIAYNLKENKAYKKAATIEVLNDNKVIHLEKIKKAEQESLYLIHTKLGEEGNYSINVMLNDENDLEVNIPFILSSQKINWGLWISITMLILIIIAAIGSRKARIVQDRKLALKQLKKK